MASKKRRSPLPETPAKSLKLKKETKGPPAKSKKRNLVTTKSKQCSTQNRNKSPLPTNKAIKKSQSSQTEGGRKKKNGNVKVTKKCNGKNVPTKQKAVPKDVAASRRSTPKSINVSKTTKKSQPSSVRKTVARATSVQSKAGKIVKSPTKSQSAKRIKNEPRKKILRKPEIKSVQAKKAARNIDKNVQTKEKKPYTTTLAKSKLTATNLKSTAPSIRTSVKNTKSNCKKDTGCTTETAKKLPRTGRTKQNPSTILRQKTVDKKKPKSAQTNVSKKSASRSVEKEKTKMDFSGTAKNKTQDPKATASTTSTDSTVPLKRKRDNNEPEVKTANKVKKQKVPKPGSDKNNQEVPTEKDQKSKRISILDLCNEIAGEIESDTVEVVKETPSTSVIPTEKEDSPMEAPPPPPTEQSPTKQSKRFFPSRKPLQVKCLLEQKTSPLTKKSKWNKIKLKKNFAPNNILRSHAVLPNLESIKVKVADQQMGTEALNAPKTSKKKPDVTSTTEIKQKEPVLSERVKINLVPFVEGESTKPSAENGLQENHVKHELEMALDEGFRLHLDSSPENSPVKKPQVTSVLVNKASEKQRTPSLGHSREQQQRVSFALVDLSCIKQTSIDLNGHCVINIPSGNTVDKKMQMVKLFGVWMLAGISTGTDEGLYVV